MTQPNQAPSLPPSEDYGHIHELKCWPMYFEPLLSGQKTFEFRKDDRAFVVGDILYLKEWDQSCAEYTGRTAWRRIGYIARGGVVPDFHCVMSVFPIEVPPSPSPKPSAKADGKLPMVAGRRVNIVFDNGYGYRIDDVDSEQYLNADPAGKEIGWDGSESTVWPTHEAALAFLAAHADQPSQPAEPASEAAPAVQEGEGKDKLTKADVPGWYEIEMPGKVFLGRWWDGVHLRYHREDGGQLIDTPATYPEAVSIRGPLIPASELSRLRSATTAQAERDRLKQQTEYMGPTLRRFRDDLEARLKSAGLPTTGYWDRWRSSPDKLPPFDYQLVELAILDALTQEGVAAWCGDASGCVTQIVHAQAKRAEAAEKKADSLQQQLADLAPQPATQEGP